VAIRPADLSRRAEERAVLEDAEKELRTAIADDEAAAPLHPHLRLDDGAAKNVRRVDVASAIGGVVPRRDRHGRHSTRIQRAVGLDGIVAR
jgi:hypothetical protein